MYNDILFFSFLLVAILLILMLMSAKWAKVSEYPPSPKRKLKSTFSEDMDKRLEEAEDGHSK